MYVIKTTVILCRAGESGDEDGVDENHQKVDEDSVFGRLEESRQTMEDQLGFSRFMKVYKYIQVHKWIFEFVLSEIFCHLFNQTFYL